MPTRHTRSFATSWLKHLVTLWSFWGRLAMICDGFRAICDWFHVVCDGMAAGSTAILAVKGAKGAKGANVFRIPPFRLSASHFGPKYWTNIDFRQNCAIFNPA